MVEIFSEVDQKNIIVVYGALRSGSTMLRLILNQHPDIHCPGETDFAFDYLSADLQSLDRDGLARDRIFQDSGLTLPQRAGAHGVADMIAEDRARSGKRFYVLMMHRGMSKLTQVLPHALYIHNLRDPRDVAKSSIGMGWAGNVWHGADHWIKTERGWNAAETDGLTQMTLRYEELVADPEGVLAALCDFVGVAFTPEMLTYHQQSSYAKVDVNLAYQWRRKQSPREVAEVEFLLGDLLERAGYDPSGYPVKKPGRLRRLSLDVQQKRAVWASRFERFGYVDPILEAIAHRLKQPQWAYAARRRMNDKVRKQLK